MTAAAGQAIAVSLLIVDDSPAVRGMIRAMLEGDGGIRIVGEAATGGEAVEMARKLRPAVILMDLQMPEMDGIEATGRIMSERAVPIIAFSSFTWGDDAKASIEMLAAGALDVMPKPDLGGGGSLRECSETLRRKIRTASRVAVVRHLRRSAPPAHAGWRCPAPEEGRAYQALGVGASTGGPAALRELFSGLPAGFPLPVLVVQHITRGFTEGFVEWLRQHTPLAVRVAEAHDRAVPGTILLAPEGRQLELLPGGEVRAVSRVPSGVHLPSADTLLSSIAASCGKGGIGVLLTGMGADGVEGLLAIRKAGGLTLAQSEGTCAVYGMPREAVRRGAALQVMSPAAMAGFLRRLAGNGAAGKGGERA